MRSVLPGCVFGYVGVVCVAVSLEALSLQTGVIYFYVGAGILLLLLRKLEQSSIVRTMPQGPLAGICVLDLSVVIAGPLACAHFAEMGAQVIKVESLDNPDSARGLGTSVAPGMASMWSNTGFGKQSIILDLKKSEGLNIFYRLLREADVVVQNFRPGVVDRIGVGYENCKKYNPNIIYVSSYGYGDKGPYSQQPVYDPIIQCLTGIPYCQRDDQTGTPVMAGQALFDKFTALSTCQAIIAALLAREKGAGGMHIETSMIDVAMQWGWSTLFRDLVWPNSHNSSAASSPSSLMSALYGTSSLKEPSLTPAQIVQSEAYKSQLYPNTKHLLFGAQRHLKYPIVFSSHRTSTNLPCAPMMGEHTAKILNELNMNAESAIRTGAANSAASMLASRKHSTAKIFKVLEFFQRCTRGTTGTFEGTRVRGAQLSSSSSTNSATGIASQPSTLTSTPDSLTSFTNGTLSGMRVVEMASLFAGPTATSLLADQGAIVMKVERTGSLDPLRQIGPFSASTNEINMGASFVALNRNKRSLTLDPVLPADCASLVALLQTVDVLVVDDEELQAWRHVLDTVVLATLVFCVIDKGKGELSVQAASGLSHTQQGRALCIPLAEQIAGYFGAIAVTTALFSRQLSGKGQKVTVPMLSTALHFSQIDTLYSVHYPALDGTPCVEYLQLMRLVAYKDGGWGYLAPLSDKQWTGFIEGFPEIIEEAEYKQHIVSGHWKTLPQRFKNFDIMMALLVRVASKCTFEQVEQRAQTYGIPHQRVLTPDEVLKHPQILVNGAVRKLEHSVLGSHQVASGPPHFSISASHVVSQAAAFPNQDGSAILQSLRSD